MSNIQILRSLVNQRLNAAVEEVFELFERTIAEYEDQLRASKEENLRQQKLLDSVLNPDIQLERTDAKQLIVREEVLPEQQERIFDPNHEITEPSYIKEESEDLWRGPERERPQGAEKADINMCSFTPVTVKSEDEDGGDPQTSQPHKNQNEAITDTELLKTEADGEDCGGSDVDREFNSDSYLQPVTHDETSQLSGSDADDTADWEESDEPQEVLNPLQNEDVAAGDMTNSTGNTAVSSCDYALCFGQKKQQKRHHVEKPFSCSVCGKRYPAQNNLKQHMLRHSEEKPFSCSVCNRSFIKKTELVTHMRSHTGEKPFQCGVCGKRFAVSGTLTAHFVIHTGVKPFTCSVCGKGFSQRGSLKQHSALHTGEKPFSCSFCKKDFYSRAETVRHMRVHTGEKPFSCSVCGKSFAQRGTLRQHAVVHIRETHQLQDLS